MGDMLKRQSACFFSVSSRPKLPPIKNVTLLFPSRAKAASFLDSASLEQVCPSMHMATTAPPSSFCRMALASAASALLISAGEGSSGRRVSGSSVTSILQYRLSRLQYSAAASA